MIIGKRTPITRLEKELAKELEFHEEIHELVAHDLRSPCAGLGLRAEEIIKTIDELHSLGSRITQETLAENIQKIRNNLQPIASYIRRITNTASILDLSDLSYDEISRESEEFSPAKEIDIIFKAWLHAAIRESKGLTLDYRTQDVEKRTRKNLGAFSTIFSNLIGNAIQYAPPKSNINAKLTLDDHLLFEVQNQIPNILDTEELNYLLRKGYRKDKSNEEKKLRNEGLGLYFVNKAVRNAFRGKLEIRSDYKKRIGSNQSREYQTQIYSPEFNVQENYPLFYARVKIPSVAL